MSNGKNYPIFTPIPNLHHAVFFNQPMIQILLKGLCMSMSYIMSFLLFFLSYISHTFLRI